MVSSLARNLALVDGNMRLALAGTIAFLGINGRRFTLANDQAYELTMDVAAGQSNEIAEITGGSGWQRAMRSPMWLDHPNTTSGGSASGHRRLRHTVPA